MRMLRLAFGFVLSGWRPSAAAPASAQLAVAIEAPPDTVSPGEALNVQVTASNTGLARVAQRHRCSSTCPRSMSAINQNYASAGGTCIGSGNLNVNCDQGETITWSLGTLGPGRAQDGVDPGVRVGRRRRTAAVLNLALRVLEAGVVRASAVETATVQSAPNFDLAVDESADPVAPGANLTYTLSFSQRQRRQRRQRFAHVCDLRPGRRFVSATSGGRFSAGVVTWNLGTLAPVQGGTRQVTVNVNPAVGRGLAASARCSATGAGSDRPLAPRRSRSSSRTLRCSSRSRPARIRSATWSTPKSCSS